MTILNDLKIKIFADGADIKSILELNKNPLIQGFTSNPTLMAKAGIKDYKQFAMDILSEIQDKPFSFEVFADDFEEMKRQAYEIMSWGKNVNIKIPITNTKSQSSIPLIQELSHNGVSLNITAVFTLEQSLQAIQALKGGAPSILSIFAGRIFDAGVDALPIMTNALAMCRNADPNIQLLWASPRQIYDVIQADKIGCDIITVSHDILTKLNSLGKDLTQFSLETVQMFRNDAIQAGYLL